MPLFSLPTSPVVTFDKGMTDNTALMLVDGMYVGHLIKEGRSTYILRLHKDGKQEDIMPFEYCDMLCIERTGDKAKDYKHIASRVGSRLFAVEQGL